MEWVKRSKNPNLQSRAPEKVSKSAYLCEHHFTVGDYACPDTKKLRVGALPSIFPMDTSELSPSDCTPASSSGIHASSLSKRNPPLSPMTPVPLLPMTSTLTSSLSTTEAQMHAISPHSGSSSTSVTLSAPTCSSIVLCTQQLSVPEPCTSTSSGSKMFTDCTDETPSSSLMTTLIPSHRECLSDNSLTMSTSFIESNTSTTPLTQTSTPKKSGNQPSPLTYPSTPNKSINISFPKHFSCRGLIDSQATPRKKYLYHKLRQCSKQISYLKQRQEKQKKLSLILKRESNNIVKLINSDSFGGSNVILTGLLRNCNVKKNNRRWNVQEKLLFLSFYKRSPRAYRYLASLINIPSVSTLKALLLLIPFHPGLNPFILKYLKKQVSRMDEKDKYCTLIFDEMSIMPSLLYNSRLDVIEGFHDHGSGRRRNGLATEALVFMVRGISKQWKQPIAYFYSSGCTRWKSLSTLIVEVITALKDTGLKVVATICDMGSNNTSALKCLGSSKAQPFICVGGDKIITLYDPPHLLKCTRNMFKKYCIEGKIAIGGVDSPAIGKWQHIEEAVNLARQYSGNIVAFPKITDACLNPQWREKMSVSMAAHVFSHALASQMDVFVGLGLMDRGAAITAEFLVFIKDLFRSFNGGEAKHKTSDLQGPLGPASPHIPFWVNALKTLKTFAFLSLPRNAAGEIILPPSGIPLVRQVIRPKSQDGWMTTIRGAIQMWSILKSYGFKCLDTRRLNQDALENLFGSIRFHSGCNRHPTVQQFASSVKTSMLHGTPKVGAAAASGNCEIDADNFLSDLEELLQNVQSLSEGIDESNLCDAADILHDEGEVSLEPITHQVQSIKLSYAVLKNVIKGITCSDCLKILCAGTSIIGESFCTDAFDRDGGKIFPTEKIQTCITDLISRLDDVVPSVATKRNIKKAITDEIDVRKELLWVKCPTHDLSVDISNAVIEYSIRKFCKRRVSTA